MEENKDMMAFALLDAHGNVRFVTRTKEVFDTVCGFYRSEIDDGVLTIDEHFNMTAEMRRLMRAELLKNV